MLFTGPVEVSVEVHTRCETLRTVHHGPGFDERDSSSTGPVFHQPARTTAASRHSQRSVPPPSFTLDLAQLAFCSRHSRPLRHAAVVSLTRWIGAIVSTAALSYGYLVTIHEKVMSHPQQILPMQDLR